MKRKKRENKMEVKEIEIKSEPANPDNFDENNAVNENNTNSSEVINIKLVKGKNNTKGKKKKSPIAEDSTNSQGDAIVQNCTDLKGDAIAENCISNVGSDSKMNTKKRKWGKKSNINNDNLDIDNNTSDLGSESKLNEENNISKEEALVIESGTINETGTEIQGKKKRKCKKKKGGNNNLEVDNNNNNNNSEADNTNIEVDNNNNNKNSSEVDNGNISKEEVCINEVGTGTETGTALLGQEKKKRKRKKRKGKNKTVPNNGTSGDTTSNLVPNNGTNWETTSNLLKDLVPNNGTNMETTSNLPKDLVPNNGTNDVTVSDLPKALVPKTRKNKLLVLDINGLLADINEEYHFSRYAHMEINGKLVFKRPFCHEFLDFCFENFEIGIWSSRMKYNVEKAVHCIMGNKKNKLLFCWDQSKCTATNFKTVENANKPLVFKELRKLWEKTSPNLPWEKGEFGPSNTLLIDDSPYKAFCNPPHTAIFPESYSFKNKDDNSLGKGGDLRVYLENLLKAENVQYFVKDNQFGQPAITDSDPSWKYYIQIIDALDKPFLSRK